MIETSTIPARGADIRSLVVEAEVDATPSELFADWTRAERFADWWGPPELSVELRIGGPLELYFLMDEEPGRRGSEGCKYLAYVPGEMVAFTWNAPPQLPLRSSNTWVVVTFAASGEGSTHLRLVHTGFLGGPDWDDYMEYFEKAWRVVLDRLREHHAD